jgi:hypothetical protein
MSENKIGRVYKLVARHSDECYVGSTFNKIHLRFSNHKSCYKKRSGAQKLTEFIDKYGIENIAMVLIKEYEVVDKFQLHAYEQLWINKHKKNCNTNPAFSIYFHKKKPKRISQKKKSKPSSIVKAQSLADVEAARLRRIQIEQ